MKRIIPAAVGAAAVVAVLAGCSENANIRDLEGVPISDPQKIEVYANIDQHPNIVRLCIDGKAFITTTRARFAVTRADYFDAWCGGTGVAR